MNDLYLYLTPKNCTASLKLANGQTVLGYGPVGAHGKPNAYHFQIPPGTAQQTVYLRVTADQGGYQPLDQQAWLLPHEPDEAQLLVADWTLTPLSATVPEDATAAEIVMGVAHSGQYDLTTGTGCGLFTEECQRQLFQQHSPVWGLVRAEPGQPDQYNGHLWDKLLAKGDLEGATLWDIVLNSASPQAQAQCLNLGPGDVTLWYSPTTPPPVG
jgi:hypothetical protein